MSNSPSSSTSSETGFPQQLEKARSYMGHLTQLQPDTMKAFSALHHAGTQEGALDKKTKELIALAIAVSAQCDGCIAYHTHDALQAGATRDEIADTLGVAVLMGGGPSMIYATHVLEAMEQFENVSSDGG